MPTITQSQIDNVQSRYIGRADIYVGVTKPADQTALVLTAGVPPLEGAGVGRWVGMSSGEAEFEYKPEIEGVDVEQALNPVGPRVVAESAQVKFTCSEAVFKNLVLAMQNATTAESGAAPVTQKAFFGGISAITPTCVTLVSSLGGGLYEHVTLYSAYSVEGLRHTYKRSSTRMVEVTLKAYADMTRSEGDQLGQLITQFP
jgi:hypothetical protein